MDMEASGAKAGGGLCQWTPTQSTFVLTFLNNVVADGTKTSTGFKKVHLNACAKALNDHFKLTRTGDQVSNHLKTWKKKYTRINYLKNLSAALWYEDEFIVSLDHDHYKGYMADPKNKADDEYLNKPLPYYGFLATIFGNSVAIGQYAKSSNEPLGIDKSEGMSNGADGIAKSDGLNHGIDKSVVNDDISSSARPAKRAKTIDDTGRKIDCLVEAFDRGSQRLAKAIEKASRGQSPRF
ncbi:hypothetical protein GQ55_7G006100 [Panicum hallii var. hallii]|uniref:Myb/SANT-like domain-containing protein n=1 Tax=Panicum hallii var. hallii TaxID=1504633 RepID=A0A2T7CRS7_9POAL|nr:hypothetical protein GQ55_7G006100 [Panicum hallii var. hallii]